jgi:hypothetical protein
MRPLLARHAGVTRARAALCAALAAGALAACGGGGGGGGGPTAGLTLTPSSGSATPGGAAVALHAAVTGSSATPAWSLSGPGTLSAASGTDVTYAPPASTAGNEAATATITASVAGLSRQVQVALAETDGPGHHWTLGLAPGTTWNDIRWGAGRFVAIGSSGAIASSTDGRHWTHADTPDRTSWVSVAYGAGVGWVAVGNGVGWAPSGASVMTSPDGVAWSAQPKLQGGPDANQIAYGNGVFVVAGTYASWVSADGKTWTPLAARLQSVAFGNGVFVGTPATGFVASADGRTWPAAASTPVAPGDIAHANDGVAFGNGVFLASSGFTLSTSPDGTHWTAAASPPYNAGHPSFAVDRFYLQWASGSTSDGRTWDDPTALAGRKGAANADGTVVVATVLDASTTPSNVALGSGPDVAHATPVLAGPLGSFSAIGCGAAGCLALMPGYAFRNDQATTWTGHVMRTDAGTLSLPGAITHVGPFGTYVAAGSRANGVAFMTSPNGIDWLEASAPANGSNGGYGAVLATGPQGLLAITDFDAVLASTGGGDWTAVGRLDLAGVTGAVYGGGRYVAVGIGTATSTDGIAWTAGTTPSDGNGPLALQGVVYDGTQFVAVGQGGHVATSPDGSTWTLHATASTAWLFDIARTDNGEMVAVGDLGVVQTSVDGVHWTLRDSGTHRWLRSVSAVPAGFFVAGEDNVILYSLN